jgi:hypothetical protein
MPYTPPPNGTVPWALALLLAVGRVKGAAPQLLTPSPASPWTDRAGWCWFRARGEGSEAAGMGWGGLESS